MGLRTQTNDPVRDPWLVFLYDLMDPRHGVPIVIGASGSSPEGMFAEYIVVDRHEVLETPPHLDDVHAAALPLAATTAWRYVGYAKFLCEPCLRTILEQSRRMRSSVRARMCS
jgi:hypothetical protein